MSKMEQIILAVLNLIVHLMPPPKLQLNPTYGSGADLKFFKLATMEAILDIGTEQI